MLAKFSVKGFKNFSEELYLDLEKVSNYEFNQECIENGVLRTALIYGPNGSGKSNLGEAIFDIVLNLTDKNKNLELFHPYLCLDTEEKEAYFYYKFKFEKGIVEYSCTKSGVEDIKKEELRINDKVVIGFDTLNDNQVIKLSGAENLNKNLFNKKISFVKYVYKNTNLNKRYKTNKLFYEFFDFVERMLFFRSLKSNQYIGFRNGSETISESIIKDNKLKEFQAFLKYNNINYELEADPIEHKQILCKFNYGYQEFYNVASTGTQALILFYFWLIKLDEASFVFVDEFDAFYHSDISKNIVNEMLHFTTTQNILTTHNTDIMTNDLLRPDCYLILEDGQIDSMVSRTKKELRFAHNLQKMYKAGAFR